MQFKDSGLPITVSGKSTKSLTGITANRLLIVGQVLVAVVFAFSGLDKLVHLDQFERHLALSPFLRAFDSDRLSRLIISVELLIPLLMIVERLRTLSVGGAVFMLVLFCGYLVRLSSFSNDISCGCNNLLAGLDIRVHIVINLAFAAVFGAVFLLRLAKSQSMTS